MYDEKQISAINTSIHSATKRHQFISLLQAISGPFIHKGHQRTQLTARLEDQKQYLQVHRAVTKFVRWRSYIASATGDITAAYLCITVVRMLSVEQPTNRKLISGYF